MSQEIDLEAVLRIIAVLFLLLPLLSACGDTGNEADDAKSAQRLLPNLAELYGIRY